MKVLLVKAREAEIRHEDKKAVGLFLKVDLEKSPGSSSSLSSSNGRRDRAGEFHEEVRKKVMSEVLLGARRFILLLRLSKTMEDEKTLDTTLHPPRQFLRTDTDITTWRAKMWDYPPAKMSVFLKIASEGDGWELRDFATIEGMDIKQLFDPAGWFCCSSIPMDMDTFPANSAMHLEIVADVPVNALLEDDDDFPPTKNIPISEVGNEVVTIISRNGAEIKANKSVLSECSAVLEAMFGSDMQESATGRLDMSNVSEVGVKAFIQYAYSRDLTMAKQDMRIAFELMRTGHMYEIRSLEVRTMEYLLEMRNEGFSVELAFEIYMFTRNVDFEIDLMKKVAEILKGKVGELMALWEYQEIFEESPESSIAQELAWEFGMPDASV